MSGRDSSVEFSAATIRAARVRQGDRCGSCGINLLVAGEIVNAHHIRHVKFGGTNDIANCVALCKPCHYSVHEGGNYRYGTVIGQASDYPHYQYSGQ